jgi:hypothetical protein
MVRAVKPREKILNQFPLAFGAGCATAMLVLGVLWAAIGRQPEPGRYPERFVAPNLFVAPDVMPHPMTTSATNAADKPFAPVAKPAPLPVPAPVMSPPVATKLAEETPLQAKALPPGRLAPKPRSKSSRTPAQAPPQPAPQQGKPSKNDLEWMEALRWLG